MMKKIKQLIAGKPTRLIQMNEQTERRILKQMRQIPNIYDYFELQKQAGYQLFAKTKDEKYLGYAEMAITFLTLFDQLNQPKEEDEEDTAGYESTVEGY